MDDKHLTALLKSSILGFAYHQIILDEADHPVDYVFLEFNKVFEAITGLKKENLLNKTFRQVYPDIIDKDYNWISVYGEVAVAGQEKEFRQYSENLQQWYKVFVYSPEPMYFSAIFHSISRKELQTEDLETFFSLSLELLCIADTAGNFVKTNKAWEKILGYSTEVLNTRQFLDFVHPDDMLATMDAIQELANGNEILSFVNRYKSSNGSYRWIEWHASPHGELIYATARDITDRVLAEKQLRNSELKYRSLFHQRHDGVVLLDMQGRHIAVNERATEMLGYEADEILKLSINDLSAEADESLQVLERLLRGEILPTFTRKFRKKNGEILPVEINVELIQGESAETSYIQSMIRDISDRSAIESQLVKEQERLAGILKGTNVGTWEWNVQTGETIFNERWAEILGYSLHEIEPVSIETWERFAHTDDLQRSADLLKKHFSGEIDYYECESRMRHKDGHWVWVLDRGKLASQTDDGQPLWILGTHQDITRQKTSEFALQRSNSFQKMVAEISSLFVKTKTETLDENTKVMLKHLGGFFNADRVYIFCFSSNNLTLSNTYEWCADGVESQRDRMQSVELDNLPWWKEKIVQLQTVHIPDVTKLPDAAKAEKAEFLLQGIQSLISVPIVSSDALSGFLGLDLVKSRYAWSENEISNLKIIANIYADTLAKVQFEDDLVSAKKQAEAASRAKSEFLANMSHEIRTPLNGVIGFTELLENTLLSPVQQQYVQNANTSGHTLLGIINDILDFSKIEAGMMELDLVQTDIYALLESSVDIVQYSANQKNLEVLLDIDHKLPQYVLLDPVRLKQILANLLSNAVKFTEQGEIELKVQYENMDERQGKLDFSVRDTGIGISELQQKRLFKAFSQADSSTTRKFGGTGLGLVISQMIAVKMGSQIHFSSEKGKGATFYFQIYTEVEQGSRQHTKDLEHLKSCLVVDDNAHNRLILQRTLALWDIETTICENGLDALQLLEENKSFDIVIIDYHMPYIDGLETIGMIYEKFDKNAAQFPLLLLYSSSDDAELLHRCDELGVHNRLTKPVKSKDLYDALLRIQDKDNAEPQVFPNSKELQPLLLSRNKYTILLAEDSEMNRILAQAMIENLLPEAVILCASTGSEAVSMYSEKKVDLIFMDIQMPVLDGIAATLRIRELEQGSAISVSIIALTAGALKEEQAKCFAAGMNDFLTKPVQLQEIRNMIQKHLIGANSGIGIHSTELKPNEQAVFDKNAFLQRIQGNKTLFEKMINAAAKTYPEMLSALQAAVESHNEEEMKALAHNLKGTAQNLCFYRIAKLTEEMEKSISTTAYTDVEDQLAALLSEWELVRLELKACT